MMRGDLRPKREGRKWEQSEKEGAMAVWATCRMSEQNGTIIRNVVTIFHVRIWVWLWCE